MARAVEKRVLCSFALQALLLIQCASSAGASVGVVYGWADADNLPIPSQAVQLMTANEVTRVRIYDTNQDILKALAGSNIQVVVGITNDELPAVGTSNATAAAWVVSNVIPYATSVNITGITVGNEVFTSLPSFSSNLVQTMRWIHDALVKNNNLAAQIRVTTPVSTAILSSSYPPSQAVFNQSLVPIMQPLLSFLELTGSYLMLNVHTFDVFQQNSASLSLKYALFEPDQPTRDAYSNLMYYSLFDALVDAGYAAIGALNTTNVNIVVGETGWPSKGDSNENGANVSNAATYNQNLVKHVLNASGTPAMPRIDITTYIYELFNEDQKPGPTSERNYGLFSYNLLAVYPLDLTGQGRVAAGNNSQYQTWCVAKASGTVSQAALQQALDWACGQGGVNCSATASGGPCFSPDTLENHASWVFNAYYQQYANAPGTCDFNGVAMIVNYDPSYGSCFFQSSNVTSSTPGSPGSPSSPSNGTNSAFPVRFHTGITLGCLLFVFGLNWT